MIELIIGIGILCAILVVMSLQISDEHDYLKFFLLVIAMSFLILLPKATMDDKCDSVVNQTIVTDNTTAYSYTTYCYSASNNNTSNIFYKNYMRFYKIVWVYIFIFIIWRAATNFDAVKGKLKNWLGGRK